MQKNISEISAFDSFYVLFETASDDSAEDEYFTDNVCKWWLVVLVSVCSLFPLISRVFWHIFQVFITVFSEPVLLSIQDWLKGFLSRQPRWPC